jgi:anti-sigma B factor antagonist
MTATSRHFEMEQQGDTLVITPLHSLGSLVESEISSELSEALDMIDGEGARNVIVDFENMSYFGSSLLESQLRLWKSVERVQGKMVLCCVSEVGREVLQISRLDRIWPTYDSRAEALAAMPKA